MERTRSDIARTESFKRRTLLSTLAAVGGAGAAGCLGNGDGDDGGGGDGGDGSGDAGDSDGDGDQELGERVPQMTMEFYGGIPGLTEEFADISEIIQRNVEEALGITLEIAPKQTGTLLNEVFNDQREQNMLITADSLEPHRLDPNELVLGESVMSAGAGVGHTQTNYANCEYSELAQAQSNAASEEEREEQVQEALSIASQDIVGINISDYAVFNAYRTDQIEITADSFTGSLNTSNTDIHLNGISVTGDADAVVTDASEDYVNSINPWVQDNPSAIIAYHQLLYTPLIRYDRNRELENVLAENYEVEDGFQTVRVTIRDDLTTENGDPVTAEDVKWTYEFIEEYTGTPGAFVRAESQPYDSIEVIDEQTVEFTFTESQPSFVTAHMPTWGILPRDDWIDQGIEEVDHPTDLDVGVNDIVSAGPYTVEAFAQNDFAELSPNEEHWQVPEHNIRWVRFQDVQGAQRAFEAGDLNIFSSADADYAQRVENELDFGGLVTPESFTRSFVGPQHSVPPTKFEELRLAFSLAINRAEINEVVYHGLANMHLHSCILGPGHPFYPDDHEGLRQITPSEEGDPEQARQTLEEAGWGWDDDGNLHYPPDADLDPLWPQGENPQDYPEEYPCVEDLDPV